MTDPNYPLARPVSGNDPRFTFGLSYDVGKVLESHGYPQVTGRDHVDLQQALFQFLYAKEEPATPAPAAGSYGDPELDGTRCIECHEDFTDADTGERERIPAGVIDGGPMGFAHHVCVFPSRASDSAALDAEFGPAVATELHAPAPIGSGLRGAPLCGARGSSALLTRDVSCVDCLVILAEMEDTAARWREKLSGTARAVSAPEGSRREDDKIKGTETHLNYAPADREPDDSPQSGGDGGQWALPISEESRVALEDDFLAAAWRRADADVSRPWRPCADCLSPMTCEEADEDRCP